MTTPAGSDRVEVRLSASETDDPVQPGGVPGSRVCHLRRGGTSVVAVLPPDSMPWIVHWGPDLGELPDADLAQLEFGLRPHPGDSRIYTQPSVPLLPQTATGWLGKPGLTGSRSGRAWSVRYDRLDHAVCEAGTPNWPDGPAGAVGLRSVALDDTSALEVSCELELHPSGLLRVRARVRNLGDDVFEVNALEPALPVPAAADELLDMAGRHTSERVPQRRPFDVGGWVRESRGGRPGHDSATILCAGYQGFSFRTGRVWGVHLAFSGNQTVSAERTFTGWRVLRGGELLLPGEVRLEAGDSYASPWLVASWGEGLDALAARIHGFLRARPQHPARPRPVLLNTWEAVYFDQDCQQLIELAEGAAAIGVERFVLDDGWFRGRRNDKAALGDWYVDEAIWPDGLHPLVNRVRELGMEFGLWFEPEMVNLDSELARTHPEWLFDSGHGPGIPSRYQHVLDLGNDGAFAYLLERISSLVGEYDIAYLKWDHNRPLLDAGHHGDGTPGVHRHTLALYRLLQELRVRHPGLEIESCAGGGGRIDLGILEYTDRVWASDCNDAHERQNIQRWTSLLLPPELVGTHIGSPEDHTTGRRHALSFRAGTAIWGHLGIEWDITKATPEELETVARWVAFYRETRALLHTGTVVHADLANPALRLEGVVAPDRRDALFELCCLEHPLTAPPGPVTLPGLDPDLRYRVRPQSPGDSYPGLIAVPEWMEHGVELSGRVLGTIGFQAPALQPDHLILIRASAV